MKIVLKPDGRPGPNSGAMFDKEGLEKNGDYRLSWCATWLGWMKNTIKKPLFQWRRLH